MNTLPLDVWRCKPGIFDQVCASCLRWAEHPNQTWGPKNTNQYSSCQRIEHKE